MATDNQHKVGKIWSVFTITSLILATGFAFLTSQCQKSMQTAQTEIPPPPPDDFVSYFVLMILVGITVVFTVLFIIGISALIIRFLKNKQSRLN